MTSHHFNIETIGIVGSGAMGRGASVPHIATRRCESAGRGGCMPFRLAPTLAHATDINEPNEARA
jgi:hypothetical protein